MNRRWWLRPAVRVGAALALPWMVPAIITVMIWSLPGDPASIICPPESCGGTEALAKRWHLDAGPLHFYKNWVSSAIVGDFGNSWRLQQGMPVSELLGTAVPNTLILLALALLLVGAGAFGGTTRWLGPKADPVLYGIGLVPGLVLALVATAVVELNYGAASFSGSAAWARLLGGAAVLGIADGAFSGAVTGTRGLFEAENTQRYVGVAVLRGERRIHNTLPNVTPALAGQMRARTLHLLSGAVIVETVLRIDGIGELLWGGTLLQDFGVVLAAATGFAIVSALLLLMQAGVEVLTAMHVRRAPVVEGGL